MLSDLSTSLNINAPNKPFPIRECQTSVRVQFKTVSPRAHNCLLSGCVTQTRPVIWGLSLSSDQTPLMALVFVTFHSSDRFIPRSRQPRPDTRAEQGLLFRVAIITKLCLFQTSAADQSCHGRVTARADVHQGGDQGPRRGGVIRDQVQRVTLSLH